MGQFVALAAFLGLVWVPAASAQAEVVAWDTDAFNDVELWTVNDHPSEQIPIGSVFVWTVSAYSGVSQMDDVELNAPMIYGDCTVVSNTWNNFTETFVEFSYLLQMTGPACSFEVGASATDADLPGIVETEAHGHLQGSVVAFTMQEFGQDPAKGSVVYWGPMLLMLTVLVLSFWFGFTWTGGVATMTVAAFVWAQDLQESILSFEKVVAMMLLAFVIEALVILKLERARNSKQNGGK